jgi:hypothetical protein
VAHRVADRVKESAASTTGTTTLTVDGAAAGFRTFASVLTTNGDTCFYQVDNGTDWEVGLCTRTSATTFTRTAILASSNADAAVNFAAGAKTAFLTDPANGERIVYYNSGTTNALNWRNGKYQRWAPNTGAQTLSITNWPVSGLMGELFIKGVNLGAATITWPTITWVKPDGSHTTTFSDYLTAAGAALQSSGTDFIYLWTDDGGATIYGKLVR